MSLCIFGIVAALLVVGGLIFKQDGWEGVGSFLIVVGCVSLIAALTLWFVVICVGSFK